MLIFYFSITDVNTRVNTSSNRSRTNGVGPRSRLAGLIIRWLCHNSRCFQGLYGPFRLPNGPYGGDDISPFCLETQQQFHPLNKWTDPNPVKYEKRI